MRQSLPDRKLTDAAVAQLEEGRRGEFESVENKERKRNPAAPFTTSKLQQDASRQLGFNVKRTMGVAQRLYEGIEIGGEGAVGLITYMRSDSTRVSPEAVQAVREWIGKKLGKQYLPASAERLQIEEGRAGRARSDSPADPELHPDEIWQISYR